MGMREMRGGNINSASAHALPARWVLCSFVWLVGWFRRDIYRSMKFLVLPT